ncbi:hypothetical protein [Bosea sp. TAB14]|uniref:hypothetical protein n=1 Tax=Bosea sp. TAB14 TaxID=3237481 RepID=UPI003F90CAA6
MDVALDHRAEQPIALVQQRRKDIAHRGEAQQRIRDRTRTIDDQNDKARGDEKISDKPDQKPHSSALYVHTFAYDTGLPPRRSKMCACQPPSATRPGRFPPDRAKRASLREAGELRSRRPDRKGL